MTTESHTLKVYHCQAMMTVRVVMAEHRVLLRSDGRTKLSLGARLGA